MADDDDDDRPHHHFTSGDFYHYFDHRHLDDCCCHDDPCDLDDQYFVLPADIYQQLVVAARDRHPTNHQPGVFGRAAPAEGNYYTRFCPVCNPPST